MINEAVTKLDKLNDMPVNDEEITETITVL